ncbi:MAG: Jag N-terminal domain-containing protein [Candidatus Hydrogenedentes bacterium]|nr:Jag N-terminal domain-containing protein [Candidatus Hydrogenedentota bacterium]
MRVADGMAATRKEAIQQALDELGVELHEVEIEVVDEGSKGFLGLGQRDVHVRVKAAHLPDDGSAELEDDDRGNRIDAPEPTRKAPQPPGRVSRRGGGRPRRGGDGRGERAQKSQQQPHMVRSGKDTRRPRTAQREARREAPREAPRPSTPRPPRRERSTPVDMESAISLGKSAAALLEEIIEKMGMDATVMSSLNEDDNIVLDVTSDSSAILIGRKGRNLEALQFIMNRIVLQGDDAETVDRIVVDIEGYVRRRIENLEDMAYSMAKKAKATNRSIRLKPLDPQERRIVHLALEDDPEIRTFSLGNSMLRRVVIVPEGAEDEDDYDDNGHDAHDGDFHDEKEDPDSVTAENAQGEPDES